MPNAAVTEPVDNAALTDVEAVVLDVLGAHVGRVVTRTTLARATGLRGLGPRRVDAVLVAVRRHVGADRLVNVRNRGWMLLDAPESLRAAEGPC